MTRTGDNSGNGKDSQRIVDIDSYRDQGSVDDQAIAWVARLRGPGRSIEMEAQFTLWLDISPEHKAAFDKALELWQLTGQIQTVTAVPAVRRYKAIYPLATAASFLVAAFVFVLALAVPSLSTERGEQRRLTLEDGTIAHLNTQSEVRVRYSNQTREIEIINGEVWFDVVHDTSWPFVVRHGQAEVEVLGTAFAVRTMDGNLLVSVTEGRVATRTGSFESELRPQDQALLSSEGIQLGTFDADEILAWRQGLLVFEDALLPDVLAELSRYLPRNMVVADEALETTRVSAVLHLTDQETMLDALGSALPLKWKQVSDDLILLSSR